MGRPQNSKRTPASSDELRRQRKEFLKKLAEVIRKNHAKPPQEKKNDK